MMVVSRGNIDIDGIRVQFKQNLFDVSTWKPLRDFLARQGLVVFLGGIQEEVVVVVTVAVAAEVEVEVVVGKRVRVVMTQQA